MRGNFYVSEISKFKQLEIKDFEHMIAYLEKLVINLKRFTSADDIKNTELCTTIINFICDQIYDLVSMLIMSIVAVRKDNDLQLRADDLQQIPGIQKKLNLSLKRISALSNFTGAHAIYSIENDYIAYQEEINLTNNPYFTSLEHFFKSSRGYKGLSIPENYQIMYTTTNTNA